MPAHRKRYRFPQPEYQLGLMLILERFCDFLDTANDSGLVFGDYEKDEITRAVLDFSQFKLTGKTSMYGGRPLGRLLDTIYFTHSHHSRFLQAADVMLYMACHCESRPASPGDKFHEKRLRGTVGSHQSRGRCQNSALALKMRNDQPALREARLWDGLTGRAITIHPSPPAARPFFYAPLHGLGKGWRLASPRLPPLPPAIATGTT